MKRKGWVSVIALTLGIVGIVGISGLVAGCGESDNQFRSTHEVQERLLALSEQEGYRKGQIDYANGNRYFVLQKQDDGTTEWVDIRPSPSPTPTPTPAPKAADTSSPPTMYEDGSWILLLPPPPSN